MHLELSTPIEQIQLQAPVMNIVNKEKVACAKVTDAQGNPITLHIHTTANEDINDAGNRAYLDVEIQEAACLDIAQQLNEHVIQKVIEQHASPEWFNNDDNFGMAVQQALGAKSSCVASVLSLIDVVGAATRH